MKGSLMERNTGGSHFRTSYRKSVVHKIIFIAVCTALCIVLAIYAATIGDYPLSASDVYGTIWKVLTGGETDSTVRHIVIDLRLPKIAGAVLCGFALAICGAAMQSMLKNPLADPYTMGISSGAGFGAAIAIILGVEILSGGGIVMNAFLFAIIPAAVILVLSRFRRATPTMMVLCGISLMYMFSAMTQMFMIIADPDDLSTVYKWMVGSLGGLDYSDLLVVLVITVAGSIYVQYAANQLNIMGIGDESAKTLGVNVERKRMVILLVITLIAASVVSFTGVIGFVGLVAPHIVRAIIGPDNRYLIPASGVFGALLLLVSHIVSITVVAPQSLPVGVITACIGGPLFMFMVLRTNKEVWS